MYYVYVLRSLSDKKLYIGSTNNLERRIKEHNSGRNVSTRKRRPFELIYFEKFEESKEARWREYKFKKSHDILKRAMKDNGPLARVVEQRTLNPRVVGLSGWNAKVPETDGSRRDRPKIQQDFMGGRIPGFEHL